MRFQFLKTKGAEKVSKAIIQGGTAEVMSHKTFLRATTGELTEEVLDLLWL